MKVTKMLFFCVFTAMGSGGNGELFNDFLDAFGAQYDLVEMPNTPLNEYNNSKTQNAVSGDTKRLQEIIDYSTTTEKFLGLAQTFCADIKRNRNRPDEAEKAAEQIKAVVGIVQAAAIAAAQLFQGINWVDKDKGSIALYYVNAAKANAKAAEAIAADVKEWITVLRLLEEALAKSKEKKEVEAVEAEKKEKENLEAEEAKLKAEEAKLKEEVAKAEKKAAADTKALENKVAAEKKAAAERAAKEKATADRIAADKAAAEKRAADQTKKAEEARRRAEEAKKLKPQEPVKPKVVERKPVEMGGK